VDSRQLLEGIVRAEAGGREDPSALALYEHIGHHMDPATAAEIVWCLCYDAERRAGRLTAVGLRVRALIHDYPAFGGPAAPVRLVAQLASAAPADLYQWLSEALEERPRDRDLVEIDLIGQGWTSIEVDAAQIGVRLPFEYFERRSHMDGTDRDAAVRSYALEQGMLV
jgi:hypothetical protein